ncbi:hypothetical protein AB1484_13860 [Parafrankia sp. FMc6]|uniref:hypothetical protein n=1 Tax=Parafrankia soli TaxID=2599596 RepID=UPI0034D6522D
MRGIELPHPGQRGKQLDVVEPVRLFPGAQVAGQHDRQVVGRCAALAVRPLGPLVLGHDLLPGRLDAPLGVAGRLPARRHALAGRRAVTGVRIGDGKGPVRAGTETDALQLSQDGLALARPHRLQRRRAAGAAGARAGGGAITATGSEDVPEHERDQHRKDGDQADEGGPQPAPPAAGEDGYRPGQPAPEARRRGQPVRHDLRQAADLPHVRPAARAQGAQWPDGMVLAVAQHPEHGGALMVAALLGGGEQPGQVHLGPVDRDYPAARAAPGLLGAFQGQELGELAEALVTEPFPATTCDAW